MAENDDLMEQALAMAEKMGIDTASAEQAITLIQAYGTASLYAERPQEALGVNEEVVMAAAMYVTHDLFSHDKFRELDRDDLCSISFIIGLVTGVVYAKENAQ